MGAKTLLQQTKKTQKIKTKHFFMQSPNNYLRAFRENIILENETYCFQNNHVYVVYENDLDSNCDYNLYIFHSTREYPATCIDCTDFTETIPPIINDEFPEGDFSPKLRDIKPPIFAELINKKINTDEDAKLALNKFAKQLMENRHEEIKDSSNYIFSFIISDCKFKDFIDKIRETQELVMHHSNLH
ncbi:2357_t:CDS:2, partial [Racocetra fulgida]